MEVRSWPELLKQDVNLAVEAIKSQDPNLDVLALPEGSVVVENYDPNRVRVYHNEANKVSKVPKTG